MLDFINILDSSLEEQKEIRNWRNAENVRKCMYNKEIINEAEHLKWLEYLKKSLRTRVYYIIYEGKKIGIVSIANLDEKNKTCDWGFYCNDNLPKGVGIGKIIEQEFISFIFNNFNIEKINCQVLSNNLKVVRMHERYGFILEGVLRKNILHDNERLDVYCLGITKEEWKNKYGK